jgi:hypothetical protein
MAVGSIRVENQRRPLSFFTVVIMLKFLENTYVHASYNTMISHPTGELLKYQHCD